MAKLKITKGPITISRGMDDEAKPIVAIAANLNPRIVLSQDHMYPIPLADRDMKVLDSELSETARGALKTLIDEVESVILSRAQKKAQRFAEDTGIELDK